MFVLDAERDDRDFDNDDDGVDDVIIIRKNSTIFEAAAATLGSHIFMTIGVCGEYGYALESSLNVDYVSNIRFLFTMIS